MDLTMLDVNGDVSIHSNTLERLALRVVGVENRLDIAALSLEFLHVHRCDYAEARIAAPILMVTEVDWDDSYDPALHRFINIGHRLDRMAVTQWSPTPPLLDRFDGADEHISLHLSIPPVSRHLSVPTDPSLVTSVELYDLTCMHIYACALL
jgi:hypothetical protein